MLMRSSPNFQSMGMTEDFCCPHCYSMQSCDARQTVERLTPRWFSDIGPVSNEDFLTFPRRFP
jgi:hypothetical protein